jgi:hypothetical protein
MLLALAVVAGSGLVASATAATATLDGQVGPSYQTNGRVAAIVTVGDTVYIGGDFTSVRPAGAAPGTGEVPRSRLAAFRLSTGALLPWNPGANSTVADLSASPDGQTIYLGGNFGRIGGKVRQHAAAVTADTGAVTPFVANTDYRVYAITATTSRIYLGGNFNTVNGVARSRVAAVDPTGAPDGSWTPNADSSVRAIAVSPDGTSVYVGGDFSSINGDTTQRRIAKLSAVDGTPQPWRAHPGYPIWSVVVTADTVYLGGDGAGGHVAAYSTKGARHWVTQTDGGVQAIALFDGLLYAGGHFDNVCVDHTTGPTSGFSCPVASAARHKLMAVDPATGEVDAWDPGANSSLGVFALTASSGALHVGGDFTRIGQKAQQGYGVFSRP